jgi:hypothetical protein
MKKAIAITSLLAFGLLIAAQPALAGKIGKRQHRMEKRITHGIKNGELTRFEVKRLVNQQRRIEKRIRLAWSDGRLSRRERARLGLLQDRASENIYRLIHNNRKRY